MKADILFATWPYIAFALLAVGLGVRYLLYRRQMNAVAEEMSESRSLFGGGKVWLMVVLVLLTEHVLLLFLPRTAIAWNANAARLYLLEGLSLAAGVIVFLKSLGVVRRHLGWKNRSAITEISDAIFFALILVGILSGVLMAVLHRWGAAWGAIILAPYVSSVLHGRPAAAFVAEMPFLVRLHVFSALAAIAVFPLTRLAAFPVAAIHQVLAMVSRPFGAMGRAGETWFRKHNPASWLWPEED